MEWTFEQNTCVVEEYKRRPVLWDSHHNLYRVATAKYDAWSEMAGIFQCAITDIKKKLCSISASYRREKSKVRSGVASSWYLYERLNFLPAHVPNISTGDSLETSFKKRPSSDDPDTKENISSEEDSGEEDENLGVIIKNEPIEAQGVQEEPITTYVVEPKKSCKQDRKKQSIKRASFKRNFSQSEKSLKKVKIAENNRNNIEELENKKDECDSFGEYIAMSLRKHDKRTQAMIKQAINNIIFEQEMKIYSNNQYTVMISNPLTALPGTEE